MKKIIGYIILLVLVCFLIPILGVKRFENLAVASNTLVENQIIEKSTQQKGELEEKQEKSEKQDRKITLLHYKTNQVEEISLDTYLYGVVSSEMPATFELEALKAQAVVARTYTMYKVNHRKHDNADICDNSACCQAWITKEDRMARWEEEVREQNWNKIVEAVDSTHGKIITYENEPINAFFHSNSGGMTEIPINVWGGSGYPYLQAVQTAGEEGYEQYYSEVTVTRSELENKIREKHSDFQIDWNASDCIKVLEYTQSNRVKTLKVGNLNLSGVEIRTLIGLKSANFKIEMSDNNIKFKVKGYGHGIGMSQTGADSMAKSGSNYEEIIKHFYQGIEIKDL